MAAPATPRRGFIGRLVGTISNYVATPRQATPPDNEPPEEAQPASTHTPITTLTKSQAPPPPEPEPWRPGMIQSKYLLEYENMFDAIAPTPKRRPVQRPQTCPPKPRNTRANAIEMPRSAMKKRSAPIDDDADPATPANNKRVKFNTALTQERVLSPPQPGERDTVPEQFRNRGLKRPRATDPYTGKHFADSPNIFDESPSKKARLETSEDSTCSDDITPNTQKNTNMNAAVSEEDGGYFVPNKAQPRPGTFALDYDTYGLGDSSPAASEDETSAPPAEAEPAHNFNPPSANSIPGRFALDFSDDSINPDASSLLNVGTPTPAPSKPPPRTSSPPPLEPSTTQNEAETTLRETTSDTPPTPPPPNAAAIDAEIAALPWPQPTTYVEAGIASQHVIDLLDDKYDEEDEYYAQQWWDREFPKFSTALKTAEKEGREIEIHL